MAIATAVYDSAATARTAIEAIAVTKLLAVVAFKESGKQKFLVVKDDT